MALQMLVVSATGYEVQDAYIKIVSYTCHSDYVIAHLKAYVSKTLADTGAAAIEGSEDTIALTVDYSDDADNAKKQIYEYTKTLDRYTDAVDV